MRELTWKWVTHPKRAFQPLGWVTLAFLFAIALPAQSIQTISPQQCVWRAGDNPAWAAPTLSDSTWQRYSEWPPKPDEPRIWIRCRADLAQLRSLPHPAIQVSIYAPYELYLDGRQLAAAGNLLTGNFSLNAIRSYAVPPAALPSGPSTIALRLTLRSLSSNSSPFLASASNGPELRTGDQSLLDGLRAQLILRQASRIFGAFLSYFITAVIAVMLFGLYYYDRSRREFLLLGIVCISLAALRSNEFCRAAMLDYSFSTFLWIVLLGNLAGTVSQIPFFFLLARRRMPLILWIVLGLVVSAYLPSLIDVLLAVRQPSWLAALNVRYAIPYGLACHMALCVAPFLAFWPYGRLSPRMRPLAFLCCAWESVDLVWYALVATAFSPATAGVFAHWGAPLLQARAVSTAGLLAALLGLLFREQRQVTQDRALLAGEMQAAQQVQRMLAPAVLDSIPSLRIRVAFFPVREVGGDFYSCRVLPDDRQRILVGDVSGKGAAAAMAAAVLLGAAHRRDTDSPAALLQHLTSVMTDMRLGGFATCLCAELAANGQLTLANAGHLVPYRNGEEVPLDSGLPLGIAADTTYAESALLLAPNDQLTFLSDGVVEAQSLSGELFGFDRTQNISTQSAESIARAAQAFGQQDDITVLTLTFAPAEVLHA